jgi:hypothetical protein
MAGMIKLAARDFENLLQVGCAFIPFVTITVDPYLFSVRYSLF